MALRIAVAAFAALRAMLVYGEAGRLTTQPIELPRRRRAPRASAAPSPV
jgi:hypothetical protein